MRLLRIDPGSRQVLELAGAASALVQAPPLPPGAYYWLSCDREALPAQLGALQAWLKALGNLPLVDLHISDLLNAHIPSTYDYTSQYDVLVFRRLITPSDSTDAHSPALAPGQVLPTLQTAPVGFALFDQLLVSVHPPQCPVQQQFVQRLLQPEPLTDQRSSALKLPASAADLMLRHINAMVDDYLSLRRGMARQMDRWQLALLHPQSRFKDWESVLQARLTLHQLDEVCEDQRSAMQDWIESLDSWPAATSPAQQRERELLRVRSRDVQEHIERVVHHVRRLEHSAETAVQMHFSAQSNRANDIMRTLTTLTAIFLPLNLIAAVFGMNFEVLPLVHQKDGFWWALAAMGLIGLALLLFFWRRRYLARDSLLGDQG